MIYYSMLRQVERPVPLKSSWEPRTALGRVLRFFRVDRALAAVLGWVEKT